MTTDAIEAGARAIYENWANYPACSNSEPWEVICEKRDTQADDFRRKSKACIEAAIASGPLVPAAQLAAERERCAKVAEQQAVEFLSTEYACNQPFSSICERFACEEVAKAIRALEPTSGEYVVVPREPTEAMILAGHHQIDWCRDDQQTHIPEHPSQQHEGLGTTCKQDICDAWTAMLNAATKDGSGIDT